jgi:hypothetical protein
MSLNWDITNCNNYKELQSDTEWGITNTLIWATMSVDMGDITESNYVEFYSRIKALEAVFGALANSSDGSYFITIEDVKKRIGLSTNVSDKTTNQFFKKIEKQIKEQLANA